MTQGCFITIEGSEGAGKSTLVRHMHKTLQAWGVDVLLTREPGGEENAEQIRSLLLDSEHLHANTELLLMFAARNEHLVKVIRPALQAGRWVLCDRFVDASYAYQGGGRGIPLQILDQLNDWIVADTEPDMTLLLDIDPQSGLQRIARRAHHDRIEQEQLGFFEKIRSAYLQRAAQAPERMVVLDASQHPKQVAEAATAHMHALRQRHG